MVWDSETIGVAFLTSFFFLLRARVWMLDKSVLEVDCSPYPALASTISLFFSINLRFVILDEKIVKNLRSNKMK